MKTGNDDSEIKKYLNILFTKYFCDRSLHENMFLCKQLKLVLPGMSGSVLDDSGHGIRLSGVQGPGFIVNNRVQF